MSQLFNRRSVASLFGGAAGALSLLSGKSALAAFLGNADIEPRGTDGILERLPNLNLEAYDEMSTSTRTWISEEMGRAAQRRAAQILRANGINPNDEVSLETAIELLADDPVIMFHGFSWQRLQRHMWHELYREFHGNFDAYMSEMEAADNASPGVLELNPGIEPEYTKHEIHMQPGGYTGDAFAGHLYHYGTNNFYNGLNYQDEVHVRLANTLPIPEDGKVRRILDAGCSCGQQVVALKQRFPDAEIWGVDIGAPMVRYAHMRAVDMGVDVNFRHALAEDTGFPDGYFDIVTSYILHHEVTADATYKIIQESARLLRPGGVYFPVDTHTSPSRKRRDKTAMGRVRGWMIHRWNHERWSLEYQSADFFGEMRRAGLILNSDGPEAQTYPRGTGGFRNILGTKPV